MILKQMEKKKSVWNTDDPQPFSCRAMELKNRFMGYIFVKLQTPLLTSVEKVIKECNEISIDDKNSPKSLILPFMGKKDNLD